MVKSIDMIRTAISRKWLIGNSVTGSRERIQFRTLRAGRLRVVTRLGFSRGAFGEQLTTKGRL